MWLNRVPWSFPFEENELAGTKKEKKPCLA
jgi:hypothetical protein